MDSGNKSFGGAFLSCGFRPFFLSAGLYAPLAIACWVGAFAGWWSLPGGRWPIWWHGHEMLFGWAMAAVCGFLLTAVPSWTSTPPVSGARLAALWLLWLLGRIAVWCSAQLPVALVAALDLLLVPALLVCVVPPIHRAGIRRHYLFPVLLVVIWLGDLLSLLPASSGWPARATTGLYLGTYAMIAMLAIIGGRVVPSFTRGALQRRGVQVTVHSSEAVAKAAVLALAVSLALDLVARNHPGQAALELANGISALLAAVLLALRARGWRFRETWSDPLLCILHVGQAWLVVAFGLRAASILLGAVPASSAFHALGAGAMATMILAFLSRAPLGHTGRPLRASRATVAAYALVVCGGVARVLAPFARVEAQLAALVAAGALFALGYAIYSAAYFAILTRPAPR